MAFTELSQLDEDVENQHAAHCVGHLDHGLANVDCQGVFQDLFNFHGLLAGQHIDRVDRQSLSDQEYVVGHK